MKLKKIEINNYKSFGANDNTLVVHNTVTSIIGKNESGKSNILNALGLLDVENNAKNSFFAAKNRVTDDPVTAILTFEFDKTDFGSKYAGLTIFNLSEGESPTFAGTFSKVFTDDKQLGECIEYIKEYRKLLAIPGEEVATFRQMVARLDALSSEVYTCTSRKNIPTKIEQWSRGMTDVSVKSKINHAAKYIDEFLDEVYSKFPVFFLYEDQDVPDSHNLNQDYFSGKTSAPQFFRSLLNVCHIDDALLNKALVSTNPGVREDARREMDSLVEKHICEPFNRFYPQEKVEISWYTSGTSATLLINTDRSTQRISERSNGLRWYLSLFVALHAKGLADKKLIFLIDEPGVHLHVEAQKKLLELFSDLTQYGSQLIYTTHSPYMLDADRVTSIRAIQKQNGESHIFNNIYDIPRIDENDRVTRLDTLSPFFAVIGLKVQDQIVFSKSRTNVVVEGINDYLYLSAVQQHLKNKEFWFIPSTGASNIHYILSILIGWGFAPKAVLDYDKAGNDESKILEKKLNFVVNKDYFYVNGNEVYAKTNSMTLENLISTGVNEQLDCPFDGSQNTKNLAAKSFSDKIHNKLLVLDQETTDNFNRLFKLLKSSE